MAREKPTIRRYAHHYPIVVEKAEGGRRAGCLECGAVAPANGHGAGAGGGGAGRGSEHRYDLHEAPKRGTRREAKPEPPWKVVLHNDWDNSMPRVVLILIRIVPGMTLKKATRIMWEAHTTGKAVVKSCHKELAELYKERLLGKGLSCSIEPLD